MRRLEKAPGPVLEDWYCGLAPAELFLRSLATGETLREVSLVAVKVRTVEQTGHRPDTGEETLQRRTVMERWLAAGEAARAWENTEGAAVFSPLRDGQVAHYDGAKYLFQTLWKRICPVFPLVKPVVCIHVQERTTQVEERAMVDAGIQAGAKRVLLYGEPLSVMLNAAPEIRELRHGYVLHIEPRD